MERLFLIELYIPALFQMTISWQHLEIGRKKSGIPKQKNTRKFAFFFNLKIPKFVINVSLKKNVVLTKRNVQ